MAGRLRDKDGLFYCRRCRQHCAPEGGAWIRLRMRNGVIVRHFICAACRRLRAGARQIAAQRLALEQLYRR